MKMENRVIHTFRCSGVSGGTGYHKWLEHYSDDMTFQDVLVHNDDKCFRSLTDDAIINDCDGNEISDDGNSEVGILRLDNNEWTSLYFEDLSDEYLRAMEDSLGYDFLKCYDIPDDEELCSLRGQIYDNVKDVNGFIPMLREDYVRENFVPNKKEVSHA
jgi:hypothetical protein